MAASNLQGDYPKGIYGSDKMATFSRDTVYAPLRTGRLYNLLQECVGCSRGRAQIS
jgi:hypothetical protein